MMAVRTPAGRVDALQALVDDRGEQIRARRAGGGCWPPNLSTRAVEAQRQHVGAPARWTMPATPSRPAATPCQSGRLASTSPAGAWTPCAVSSSAVDARAWSAVRQRARLTTSRRLSPTRSPRAGSTPYRSPAS